MDTVKAEWSTAAPLTAFELVNELLKRGCHQVDIAEAISEQDPHWIEKSPDRSKPTWPSDRVSGQPIPARAGDRLLVHWSECQGRSPRLGYSRSATSLAISALRLSP